MYENLFSREEWDIIQEEETKNIEAPESLDLLWGNGHNHPSLN